MFKKLLEISEFYKPRGLRISCEKEAILRIEEEKRTNQPAPWDTYILGPDQCLVRKRREKTPPES